MYDVNVKRIKQILEFSERILSEVELDQASVPQAHTNILTLLSLQRVLQIHFEVFTDVTNLLIDGFVMRDPGGYEDMVDILDDEQVISAETSMMLRELIDFYRQSVKEYLTFEIGSTSQYYEAIYPRLRIFNKEVWSYLQEELPAEQLA